MAVMTREQILTKQVLKTEKVKLSNGEVYVRQMNGRGRDDFEQSLGHWESYVDGQGVPQERYARSLKDFRAKLAVCTLCDKDGNLLLTLDDAPALSENMSASDLERIVNAAQKLNLITATDKEELIKN